MYHRLRNKPLSYNQRQAETEVDRAHRAALTMHGGTGSGNFGHEGRAGERGGSGEGTESQKVKLSRSETARLEVAKSSGSYRVSYLSSRARNGGDTKGVITHFVNGWTALCGREPQGSSAGWSEWGVTGLPLSVADHPSVSCPHCAKIMAALLDKEAGSGKK
jgi:hypothetical protein